MRILHSSDWHLGKTLHGRKRNGEFQAFLDWLVDVVSGENVDALIVAGDIFDSGTPSNQAQEMYYRFLWRVADSPCRNVVLIAGNHDSPSFLEAPRELLRVLDIHVVGGVPEDPADEIVTLSDGDGKPGLIVCAVPHLRDRDIREVEPGESPLDKERKLAEGIRNHYAAVAEAAARRREKLGGGIPVVATGHLFVAGGRTGDGVRELYVGNLGRVGGDVFSPVFDYVALGHLHLPQRVGGSDTRRYSGSPLQMGFGEAGQAKSVCLVDFLPGGPSVRLLETPVFQALATVRGDWRAIADGVGALAAAGTPTWLEVVHDGPAVLPDLRERVGELVRDTLVEPLRAADERAVREALERGESAESLDDLDPMGVFDRCLERNRVPEEDREALRLAYAEIVEEVLEGDQAE